LDKNGDKINNRKEEYRGGEKRVKKLWFFLS
jgi:hypothetical protein